MDLTGIGCEMMDEIHEDSIRSQSAPVTPTKMFDKEFLSYEQEEMFVDNFVYNIDLSNGNQSTRPTQSRREIFFVSSRGFFFRIHFLKREFKVMLNNVYSSNKFFFFLRVARLS